MSGRHVTANAYGYKVMGYPIVLDDESYPRNQFIFNICFVCYPWSRTVKKGGDIHTWAPTKFQQGGKIFPFREGDYLK